MNPGAPALKAWSLSHWTTWEPLPSPHLNTHSMYISCFVPLNYSMVLKLALLFHVSRFLYPPFFLLPGNQSPLPSVHKTFPHPALMHGLVNVSLHPFLPTSIHVAFTWVYPAPTQDVVHWGREGHLVQLDVWVSGRIGRQMDRRALSTVRPTMF